MKFYSKIYENLLIFKPQRTDTYTSNVLYTNNNSVAHIKKSKFTKEIYFIFLAVAISLVINIIFTLQTAHSQERIADNVIRLHIRAKSNSLEDQATKLYVRDNVLHYLKNNVEMNDLQSAKSNIQQNIQPIEQYVNELLSNKGYDYKATVSLDKEMFPIKDYGVLALPEGEYTSLVINLDEGEGNNWWCVVYPQLCFIEDANLKVDSEELDTLKDSIEDEDFSLITSRSGKFKMKTAFNFN